MIKLSVIVPVYNAEQTLQDCLSSLQVQNCQDIEIILVNDGSKDGSLELCKKMAENDHRIIVIDSENEGVSAARNKGIKRASGEYIAFVDADDSVEADIYTEMLSVARRNRAPIVFCNYKEVDESGNERAVDQIQFLGKDRADSRLVVSRLISISKEALFGVVWRTLFKKSLITDNNIAFTPDLTMAEDLQFLLKCLKYTDQVGLCSKYLYNFKVSNQSTTGRYMEKQDDDMRYVNDWMMKYVKEFHENKDLVSGVEICMANTLILNVANVCKLSTPYNILGRIKYAYSLTKEEKYRHALKVAMRHKEQIVTNRYNQMILMLHHMAFVNVLFHSLKNHTLFK